MQSSTGSGSRLRRGVAYIEVLIAAAVTLLGALAILGLLDVSSQTAKASQYYTLAAQIARSEIEHIRSTEPCLVSNRTDAALTKPSPDISKLPRGAATLTIANSSLLAGAKDITVRVTWRGPSTGADRSLVLKTMVSPNGPTH